LLCSLFLPLCPFSFLPFSVACWGPWLSYTPLSPHLPSCFFLAHHRSHTDPRAHKPSLSELAPSFPS
jgi:hypothetical protein